MSFKPSLVEHVFRGVWASNSGGGGGGGAVDSGGNGGSDDEAEFLAGSEVADASRVTKISQDTLKLSGELLRLLVLEAFRRAQMEAMVDDSPTVEPHHVEQILAQLLLDF